MGLRTHTSNLTTFADAARIGDGHPAWSDATKAAAQDNDHAKITPITALSSGFTSYLRGLDLLHKMPAGTPVQVKLKVRRYKFIATPGIGDTSIKDSQVCMVIAGSVQTGTNLAFTAVEWSGVDYEDVTYTWTQANLTTMNLTTHTQVNGATWGFALSAAIIDTGATLEPCVDFMGQVEITYRVRGKGWLKVILGCLAALPSLVLPRLCKAA